VRTYVRWLLVAIAIALLCLAAAALHRLHRGRDLVSAARSLIAMRALGTPGNGHEIDPGKLVRAPYADAVYVGTLENRYLREISGLVASRRRDDVLWGVNDSGGKPKLFAVGLDGRDLGSVRIYGGVRNVDWEDLSIFERDGRSYLIVADIGDNFEWRRRVDLYIVEEPEVGPDGVPARAPVAWRIPFHYEDGPHDCEALAFDPSSGQVLVVTKRDVPPVLYGFALGASHDASEREAKRLGELVRLPQPTQEDRAEDWLRGPTRSQITALSIAPDGATAVLLTYRDGYQFARGPDETWAAAFARTPLRIPVPPMPQKEAMTFGHTGRTLFATSEQQPSPLFRFDPRDSSVEPAREK